MSLSEYDKPEFSGWSIWVCPHKESTAYTAASAVIRHVAQPQLLPTTSPKPFGSFCVANAIEVLKISVSTVHVFVFFNGRQMEAEREGEKEKEDVEGRKLINEKSESDNIVKVKVDFTREQSNSHGTPVFCPHVTLFPAFVCPEKEAVQRTKYLANQLKTFRIQLTAVNSGTLYFQCVYASVNPTQDVLQANQKAREIFDIHSHPPFMPHMSLVYGDLPNEKKQEITSALTSSVSGLEFNAHELQ
eukprot:Ihof_evm11s14 gene=Ihof_evmTU11s14